MIKSKIPTAIATAAVAIAITLYGPLAGEENADKAKKNSETTQKKEPLHDEAIETMHSVRIGGVDVSYKATIGSIVLKGDNGDPKASLSYIAYVKEGIEDHSRRPITFCFNGGPGSASIWLHLGLLGPKRVLVLDGEFTPASPNKVVDNEYSLLDSTDLVFIDPVSTGFSRAAPGEDPKQFHSVDEDIKSIAEFIRIFTTRNDRWASPKFLAGESYGTIRAAGLAGYMHKENKMYLNGLILISAILNYQTISENDGGNDLPFILNLPSCTATAWFHKKLPEDLQKDLKIALKESESFALNEYTLALMQGDRLDPKKREEVTKKLSRLTGVSPEYIDRTHMRMNPYRFFKELLRNEKRTTGRFDSRFTGIDSDACGENSEYDPSTEAIFGVFTSAFNHYIRKELQWKRDDEYKILVNVSPWNFNKATNKFLNVAETLRETMTKNPNLTVFVASGYYDMATPYFAAEYTFNHLFLDPSLRGNISMNHYEAGHMMYLNPASLVKLKQDLASYINRTMKK